MRRAGKMTVLLVLGGAFGAALTGCALAEQEAEQVASRVKGEVSRVTQDKISGSCEKAISAVENSGSAAAGAGKAGADQLGDELTNAIDPQYRDLMGDVATRISQEAEQQGLTNALDKAAPAEKREAWHDMAVNVCTQEVTSQAGLGGGEG
ncbi:MAG: hypothetical protein ACRDPK_16580 [Carbonactinosporaceae bacterium]